jgi:hypothetical protein
MRTRPDATQASDEFEDTGTSDLGPNSAGQSGDTQGILNDEDSNDEGVRELLEEGQSYEASVVSGIENVPPADEAEVTTRQVPEDDVPGEYLDEVEFRK